MWKPTRSRAEQHFASGQKNDQTLIKQKEKTQRERDERMARLRDLRLAKEAAEQSAAEETTAPQADGAGKAAAKSEPLAESEDVSARLPRVHTHRS